MSFVIRGLDRIAARAWLMPLALGLVAVGMHQAFSWPALHPSLWDDYAVAAGLRCPARALSGVWLMLLSAIYACVPAATVELAMSAFGILSSGALAVLAYWLLADFLPPKLCARLRTMPHGVAIERCMLAWGAALFVFHESVWCACQAPGVPLVRLLGVLLAIRLAVSAFRRGGYFRLQLVAVMLGVMVSDGVFTIALFALLMGMLYWRSNIKLLLTDNALTNPLMLRSVSVRFSFAFLLTAALALAADYAFYRIFGGVELSGFLPGDVVSVLVGGFYASARASLSLVGGAVLFFCTALPLVLVVVLQRQMLTFGAAASRFRLIVFGVMAVLVWTQVSGIRSLSPIPPFNDLFLTALVALASVFAVVLSLMAVAVGLPACGKGRFAKGVRWGLVAFAAFALLAAMLTRVQTPRRAMMEVVDAYCREVSVEGADARCVLTDGALDAGVELAANCADRSLVAVSMVSGGDAFSVKLRQRGVEDEEDLNALESGAADALRYWMDARTNRLAEVTAQFGFDRRPSYTDGNRPRASGLLAHFGGEAGEAEREGIASARSLGEWILEICASCVPEECGDGMLAEKFRFVQWRVAEMCRIRVRLRGVGPDDPEKAADRSLAERLDAANPRRAMLVRRAGPLAEHHGAMLLPRESLKIAVMRHDFARAGKFAEEVLKAEPLDPQANFALGMMHYFNRQYARSLPCLEKALVTEGNNPQLLNNLSVVHLRLNNLKEALEYAERAAQIAPDNPNFRHTVERVRQKIRESLGGNGK